MRDRGQARLPSAESVWLRVMPVGVADRGDYLSLLEAGEILTVICGFSPRTGRRAPVMPLALGRTGAAGGPWRRPRPGWSRRAWLECSTRARWRSWLR